MKTLRRFKDNRALTLRTQTWNQLNKKGYISTSGEELQSGKESKIFAATSSDEDYPILVKFFYFVENTNRFRRQNFKQDQRFSSRKRYNNVKTISECMAEKEARNLLRIQSFKNDLLKTPKVSGFFSNAVVLEKITIHDKLAPTLRCYMKDNQMDAPTILGLYKRSLLSYSLLLKDSLLLHGDYSSDNILYNGELYVIDFAQAIRLSSSNLFRIMRFEKEILIKDIKVLNEFFNQYIDVIKVESVINYCWKCWKENFKNNELIDELDKIYNVEHFVSDIEEDGWDEYLDLAEDLHGLDEEDFFDEDTIYKLNDLLDK
eukprot:GAHX01002814.1.p1 GENE.GAHX01002814.1~~GAHX01002814.1.p1  ORF type:complete len:327 (+),score=58.75 GAHX01002814.1:33-983(+)